MIRSFVTKYGGRVVRFNVLKAERVKAGLVVHVSASPGRDIPIQVTTAIIEIEEGFGGRVVLGDRIVLVSDLYVFDDIRVWEGAFDKLAWAARPVWDVV